MRGLPANRNEMSFNDNMLGPNINGHAAGMENHFNASNIATYTISGMTDDALPFNRKEKFAVKIVLKGRNEKGELVCEETYYFQGT